MKKKKLLWQYSFNSIYIIVPVQFVELLKKLIIIKVYLYTQVRLLLLLNDGMNEILDNSTLLYLGIYRRLKKCIVCNIINSCVMYTAHIIREEFILNK